MVQAQGNDGVFSNISQNFSTTDIRTVYTFKKMIGGGHFGTVRTAHLKTDPQVTYAIKSILRENIEKDIKLLEEELFILRQVDHPNIVKYYETYIDEKYIYLVMEYIGGGELFDKIANTEN